MTPGKSAKYPMPYKAEIMASFYNVIFKHTKKLTMESAIAIMKHHVPKWRDCLWVDRKVKKIVQYYVVVKHQPIAKHKDGGYCWDTRPTTWKKEEKYYQRSIESASERRKAASIILKRYANRKMV